MDIELSRGFVAFPRGLTDWEWYTEPNTARLYFHLLLTANWSRKQWQGITIQPGQLVTSQPHLAAQLNLSTMQVRSALKHLQTTGYITVKTGPKYSLITLENYNLITGLNRLDNRQATGKQPADTSLAATLYHQYHQNQKYHHHLPKKRRRRASTLLFLRNTKQISVSLRPDAKRSWLNMPTVWGMR